MSGIERVGRWRSDASVDIIFVHGLGGNWRTTWEFVSQPTKQKFDPRPESKINPTANAELATRVEANALFWPEWIADSFPTAVVWALDYEANRSDWWPGMALSQHGEQALAILAANGFGKRPIVFIVHSLGGLVVKSLLQASYDDFGAAIRLLHGQLVVSFSLQRRILVLD